MIQKGTKFCEHSVGTASARGSWKPPILVDAGRQLLGGTKLSLEPKPKILAAILGACPEAQSCMAAGKLEGLGTAQAHHHDLLSHLNMMAGCCL